MTEQEAQQAQNTEIMRQVEKMQKDFCAGKWVPPSWAAWFASRRK